jgi:uncharacterized phage protein (TIGR02218 family)
MIELYKFTAGETAYRYTSTMHDVVHDGETWTAITISRGGISIDSSESDTLLRIETRQDNEVARLYAEIPPDSPVGVDVYQLDGADESLVWSGVIQAIAWDGIRAVMQCGGDGSGRIDSAPRIRYQAQCRHALYGRACGVDKESFKVTGDVDSISADGLTITSSDLSAESSGWYTGGVFIARGQSRTIIAQPTATSITIDRKIKGLVATDAFVSHAGCDRTIATCRDKFDNRLSYGGLVAIPKTNPFSRSVQIGTD